MSYGQQNPYAQENPYQQGPSQESGYGYGQANPYSQEQYELNDYQNNQQQAAPSLQPTTLDQNEYLNRVQKLREDIKNLTYDIDYIGQLHQRTLSSTDNAANQELEQYVTQTQIRNTAIKDGIKGLERDLAKTTDSSRNTKNTQLQSLKTLFKSELDKYQSIEHEYKQRYREQIARQYRIVNPEASEEEVREAASANWGDEGVFQTALRTNRTGHATSLLGNVRARHNELQRIEHTLNELSVLYQELAAVVEQQDTVIQAAEESTAKTTDYIDQGNTQIKTATDSARRARKLKWWCFFVVVLIILAVALGVGLGVGLASNATGN